MPQWKPRWWRHISSFSDPHAWLNLTKALMCGRTQTYLSLHSFCCFHIWGLAVCHWVCESNQTERLTITNYFYWALAEWKRGVKIQVQVSSKWFVLVLLIKTKDGVVCRMNPTREAVIGDFSFCRRTASKFVTTPGKQFVWTQSWVNISTYLEVAFLVYWTFCVSKIN